MKIRQPEDLGELRALCESARTLISSSSFNECEQLIRDALSRYPHMPEPNNLYGILLENQGDHLLAMKHFRAAWALNPAYLPARQNLERFGTFFSTESVAFNESDCPPDPITEPFVIEYDSYGVGHIIKKR